MFGHVLARLSVRSAACGGWGAGVKRVRMASCGLGVGRARPSRAGQPADGVTPPQAARGGQRDALAHALKTRWSETAAASGGRESDVRALKLELVDRKKDPWRRRRTPRRRPSAPVVRFRPFFSPHRGAHCAHSPAPRRQREDERRKRRTCGKFDKNFDLFRMTIPIAASSSIAQHKLIA